LPGADAEFIGVSATTTRWRRYGKDRLYVAAADGTKVGWRDLLTGEDHIEAVAYGAEYEAAVAAWEADANQSRVESITPVVAAAAGNASGPSLDAAYEDLASRRAGAAAREKALAHREAAPIRTLLARALNVHTEERAWRVGADGEEKVGARLDKLMRKDPRWHVLHAVPIGERGSDIDHVVIGPGGVFTLNAKNHPGKSVWVASDTFMVNGQRHPYVRNSRFEAARSSKLLTAACGFPVFATGLVVLVGAERLEIKEPSADVHVVGRMALANWLRARSTRLDEATIETIYAAARRSTTWQPAA
jgi:hypothetical protein